MTNLQPHHLHHFINTLPISNEEKEACQELIDKHGVSQKTLNTLQLFLLTIARHHLSQAELLSQEKDLIEDVLKAAQQTANSH